MYGIMRLKKFKRKAIYGLQQERCRTKNDERNYAYSDIDKDRTDKNIHVKQTDGSWNRAITKRIKESGAVERKDSVVLMGGVFTASKEYFQQHPEDEMRYFQECINFYVREYCGGDASLVIDCTIDRDETTDHLQIYSIPIVQREGQTPRLSAKDLFGDRNKLRQAQDKFFEQVCQSRGLQRGEKVDWDIPYSERKKHKTAREYKRAQERAERDQLAKDVSTLTQAKKTINQECHQMVANAEQLLDQTKDELLKQDALEFIDKGTYLNNSGYKVALKDVFEKKYLPQKGHTIKPEYQEIENAFERIQNVSEGLLDDQDEEITFKQ